MQALITLILPILLVNSQMIPVPRFLRPAVVPVTTVILQAWDSTLACESAMDVFLIANARHWCRGPELPGHGTSHGAMASRNVRYCQIAEQCDAAFQCEVLRPVWNCTLDFLRQWFAAAEVKFVCAEWIPHVLIEGVRPNNVAKCYSQAQVSQRRDAIAAAADANTPRINVILDEGKYYIAFRTSRQ